MSGCPASGHTGAPTGAQDCVPQPGRRADGRPRATPGVRGRAQRLPVRRVLGVAHGQPHPRGALSALAPDPPLLPSTWDRPGGPCLECGFDWAEADYELLVGQCMHNVADFGSVLSQIDPTEAVGPGLWSASRYVWHTVDVLRFGTERLWTISADPSFGVPTWDENVLADVRSYDHLSPFVGLIALVAAAGGRAPQPSRRPLTRPRRIPKPARSAPSTSCSATRTRSATTSGTCAGRRATDDTAFRASRTDARSDGQRHDSGEVRS